jgi:hypothetical protein
LDGIEQLSVDLVSDTALTLEESKFI